MSVVLSFKKQLRREFEQFGYQGSLIFSQACKEAYKAVVDLSDASTSLYYETGTLQVSWQLKIGTSAGKPRQRRQQGAVGKVPKLQYRFSRDSKKSVKLFNKMPYTTFVDLGINPIATPPPPANFEYHALLAFDNYVNINKHRLK